MAYSYAVSGCVGLAHTQGVAVVLPRQFTPNHHHNILNDYATPGRRQTVTSEGQYLHAPTDAPQRENSSDPSYLSLHSDNTNTYDRIVSVEGERQPAAVGPVSDQQQQQQLLTADAGEKSRKITLPSSREEQLEDSLSASGCVEPPVYDQIHSKENLLSSVDPGIDEQRTRTRKRLRNFVVIFALVILSITVMICISFITYKSVVRDTEKELTTFPCSTSTTFIASRPQRINLPDHCRGMSVTQLRDVIYVICFKFNEILKYKAVGVVLGDAIEFPQLPDSIVLKDARALEDITASSSSGEFLYVYDHGSDDTDFCVWRVSVDTNDVTKWLAARELGDISRKLSVDSSGRLLTLGVDTPRRMHIYGKNSSLERSVDLPLEWSYPIHVVENFSSGNFVIVYTRSDGSEDGVSEIDKDGKILRTYDSRPDGKETLRVSHPQNVAVDERGSVYVCDYRNKRVVVLDHRLRACYVLSVNNRSTSIEDQESPHTLYFVANTTRLLVGFFSYVDIYT